MLQLVWDVSDADSDAIEIRIDYSADADKPFRPVFVGPNRGTWNVPGSQLAAASQARLRLVASDGFNESAVVIEPISVLAAPPNLEILEPEADTNFPHTTPIRLQAAAFGNDLQPLPESQLEWSVDGRDAGSGVDVEVLDLKPGRHTAKVVARDGKLASTREVSFTIREQITATAGDPSKSPFNWRVLLYILAALVVIVIIAWLLARRARRAAA
jgi:hypothetical protein